MFIQMLVISMFKERHVMYWIETNQLTGNVYNDSEVTMKVKEEIRARYPKYVFLLGKTNSV